MVPKVQYSYRYQGKSTVLGTNFRTKAKHKNMLIKNHTIFINQVKKNELYKNQYYSLYLFKIVFQVFPQVIKVWKTVNKFHTS